MKKTLLTCLICASLLSLCSCSGNSPVQTAGSSSEAQNDNGIEQVTLKVWAEEAAFDMMNEMIESFKEAHRGEAEFNITIEQNLDSKTKDVILGDVHNGADVFPPAGRSAVRDGRRRSSVCYSEPGRSQRRQHCRVGSCGEHKRRYVRLPHDRGQRIFSFIIIRSF